MSRMGSGARQRGGGAGALQRCLGRRSGARAIASQAGEAAHTPSFDAGRVDRSRGPLGDGTCRAFKSTITRSAYPQRRRAPFCLPSRPPKRRHNTSCATHTGRQLTVACSLDRGICPSACRRCRTPLANTFASTTRPSPCSTPRPPPPRRSRSGRCCRPPCTWPPLRARERQGWQSAGWPRAKPCAANGRW